MPEYLIDIETDQIGVLKKLFEQIKDILIDIPFEFIRGNVGNNDNKDKNESDEESDEDKEEDKGEDKGEDKVEKNDNNTDIVKKQEMNGGCIRFTATDHTKTSIINMALFGNQFNKFEIGKSVVDVGINLAQFYKIIKSIENDDVMRLYIDKEDRQNLVIETKRGSGESDSCSKMKLMDINKKKLNIPPTSFDAVITIDTNQFHKKCKDMSNFADYIDIQCTRNKLTFTCKGDAIDHSHNFYPETSGVRIKFAKNAPPVVQGIFELKYIVMFTKCSGLCDEIQIFMKNNYPLSINYTIATLGRILFCLAPVPEDVISKHFDDEDELYEPNEVKYKNKD
jgi:proliferating cell nuclear antigen